MKLYIICGHGAGDSGACGQGFEEQQVVRWLAEYIKKHGGDAVEVLDTSRNWYEDEGINSLDIPASDCLIELHLDAADSSARGGHVIIWGGYDPDEYDKALAAFIGSMYAGRSQTIKRRYDLANPNLAASRGINYRLLEVCFITNSADMDVLLGNMDKTAIGILAAFGIPDVYQEPANEEPAPAPKEEVPEKQSKKRIDIIAHEVIRGDYGNGEARKQNLAKAGYDYDTVQARVNEILGY